MSVKYKPKTTGFWGSIGNFFSGLISGIAGALGISGGFHAPSNPLNVLGHVATGNVTGFIGDFFGPAIKTLDGPSVASKPYTPPASGVGGRDVFGNAPEWQNKPL